MSQVFCVPLNNLAVLELKGGQPNKLLQGQITADLNLVSREQALPGLLCNLKGRVISSFEVITFAADHLALILPADNREAVEAHLKQYEPFFKTKITHTTSQYKLLGFSGKETPALLLSLLGAWPKTDYRQAVTETGLILHLPGPLARALVLLDYHHDDFTYIINKLDSLTEEAPTDYWHLLDIQAGRAQVDAQLSNRYLPQMLNFQALGAVSFKKGCYIGQEIVARTQFRGQVKKRLHRVHLTAQDLALPASIYDSQGQHQGDIIEMAPDRRGELEALAVINQKALQENERFYADPEQQVRASLLKLPYDSQARVALHGAEA